MKKELVTELLMKSFEATRPEDVSLSFSQSEVERLVENVVDKCITVLEREMEVALKEKNGDLYASLVNTAFGIMDEFGIDELANVDDLVDQLMSSVVDAGKPE